MVARILILLVGCVAGTGVIAEESARIFTRAESFHYSAANPLTAYMNMLVGPAPEGGRHTFSRNSVEVGVAIDKLEFSLIHRNDYNLDFSQQASEFAYLNKNRKTIPLDQEYDVDVWANQYQVTGAKLGYELALSGTFSVTFGYSQLYATEAVSGYMGANEDGSGGVISITERDVNGTPIRVLDGELHADYFYTDDPLFRRGVDAPSGRGYAVDLGFKWQVTHRLLLEGRIDDLAGEIRWRNLPHTVADVTSETVVVDDEGFLQAYPNFAGVETVDNYNQSLTQRERVGLHYQYNQYYFGYEYDRIRYVDFNRLAVGYNWSEDFGIKMSREMTTGAFGLGLLTPYGELHFAIDETDMDLAHALRFGWNLSFPL